MTYSVLWVPAAERKLAELWTDAARRRGVSDAANAIDVRLRNAPLDAGESRERGRRILLVPPLGVKFEVLPVDRLVHVLDVWRFGKRGS
jgi:plasmid stabilization system protein ParE